LRVLDSGCLAQGPEVEAFEKEFAKFVGAKYAVTTTSGTTALWLALMALNIGGGDEVITTPFSFIASSNSILYASAKPIFADIKAETYNIDPAKIENKITKKTKAIIPVHLYGYPAEMEKIMVIAKKYNLKVIEDACQAHGAKINGKSVGSFGDAACFSFYPTKNMTTGEGGIVTFKDKSVYEKALMLRAHGMKIRYHHEILGHNLRMTDIHASIGREQLKKLPDFNKKRQNNAAKLTKTINSKKVNLPQVEDGYEHVFHQFTITTNDRENVIKTLDEKGIGTGIHYPICINEQPFYKKMGYSPEDTPVAHEVSRKVISLPIHPALTDEEIQIISDTINSL
ncbi:aminotransferase DegT, partial [bacterium (Candidatus Howlettbacteria) CG23_combo_of_CG06-09_8_20_14_all_37_9]